MTNTEAITLITSVVIAITEFVLLWIFFERLRKIEENTADTNLLLKHIVDLLDKDDARSTLDELEDELNSNPRR